MGYRIDYQTTSKFLYPRRRGISGLAVSVAVVILIALLVNVCFPQARGFLQGILFPEGTAVTVSALEEMAWDLKNGQPFKQSFMDFCLQVIHP